MKGKKLIFLVLALLFPVTIFIFLKLFGRNEFQVPVRFTNAMPEMPADCDYDYSAPYLIADSVMKVFQGNGRDSLYVFSLDDKHAEAMGRITAEFGDDAVQVIDGEDAKAKFDASFLRRCVLLMRGDAAVALVDHGRRIRGYYDAKDREEVDRLIVEMKIILKQY